MGIQETSCSNEMSDDQLLISGNWSKKHAHVINMRQTPELDARLDQRRDPLLCVPAPKSCAAHPTQLAHSDHNRRQTGALRRPPQHVLTHPLRLGVARRQRTLRIHELFLDALGSRMFCFEEGNWKV